MKVKVNFEQKTFLPPPEEGEDGGVKRAHSFLARIDIPPSPPSSWGGRSIFLSSFTGQLWSDLSNSLKAEDI
jgi:hypothetical protein